WAIYQIYATRKLAKITSDLNQEVHRLNTNLDQSIQRLYRARDLVIQIHEVEVYFLYENLRQAAHTEPMSLKSAEKSSHMAKLRGLAFAIEDKELLGIVNELRPLDAEQNIAATEMTIRLHSQKLHTRISQLLQETTRFGNHALKD